MFMSWECKQRLPKLVSQNRKKCLVPCQSVAPRSKKTKTKTRRPHFLWLDNIILHLKTVKRLKRGIAGEISLKIRVKKYQFWLYWCQNYQHKTFIFGPELNFVSDTALFIIKHFMTMYETIFNVFSLIAMNS